MRRLILALMILLTTVCESYAVSDEVFEAKMETFTNEIRGEFQIMDAKIDALSKRIDGFDKRIDDIMHRLLIILGMIMLVAVLSSVSKALDISREPKSQLATIEDVKRLIAEAESKLAS